MHILFGLSSNIKSNLNLGANSLILLCIVEFLYAIFSKGNASSSITLSQVKVLTRSYKLNETSFLYLFKLSLVTVESSKTINSLSSVNKRLFII